MNRNRDNVLNRNNIIPVDFKNAKVPVESSSRNHTLLRDMLKSKYPNMIKSPNQLLGEELFMNDFYIDQKQFLDIASSPDATSLDINLKNGWHVRLAFVQIDGSNVLRNMFLYAPNHEYTIAQYEFISTNKPDIMKLERSVYIVNSEGRVDITYKWNNKGALNFIREEIEFFDTKNPGTRHVVKNYSRVSSIVEGKELRCEYETDSKSDFSNAAFYFGKKKIPEEIFDKIIEINY